MKLALIGDEEYEVFDRIPGEAELIPLPELSLRTTDGQSGVDRGQQRLEPFDAVFIQAQPRLMLFIEPLLDELTERGVACQLKPTVFNILANKPYTFVSLASRNVPIPMTRSVATSSAIESAVEGMRFPIIIEAFRDLDRTHSMILTDKQSLYPWLRSVPFEYNLILIQELLQDTLYESLVIGDDVFSTQRSWNAERLTHSGKRKSTKMSSEDKDTVVRAAKALGTDIARIKMIDGKVIEVDPIVNIERFDVLGVDLPGRIRNYFEAKLS